MEEFNVTMEPTLLHTNLMTADISLTTSSAINVSADNIFSWKYTPLDWLNYTEAFTYAMLSLIGLPCNCFVIHILLRNSEVSSTDYLVSALAFVDVFDATIISPCLVWYILDPSSILSVLFCKATNFCGYGEVLTSAAFIGALAVDRYFLTCKPLSKWYSKDVAKYLCGIIPVCIVVLVSPFLIAISYDSVKKMCRTVKGYERLMNGIDIAMSVTVFVDVILVLVCYPKIALMLRRRMKNRRKSKISIIQNQKVCSRRNDTSTEFTDVKNSTQDGSNKLSNDATPEVKSIKNAFNILHLQKKEVRSAHTILETGRSAQQNVSSTSEKTREQTANRTTLVLFLLSLVFLLTFIAVITVILFRTFFSRGVKIIILITRRVSIVSNPVMYISVSSRFRTRAKQLLSDMFTCHKNK